MKAEESIEVLLSEEQVQRRVAELGAQITRDYADRGDGLVLIGVLKGCFPFLADLCRRIDLPLTVEFLGCSSYGEGTTSTGVVQITHDLTRPIDGKHVLIVEDIVDTGLTLRYLVENLGTRKPASLKVCSLLHKPEQDKGRVPIDYLGFAIENRFVIGYGLDLAQRFRNLPYIGVWKGGSTARYALLRRGRRRPEPGARSCVGVT